MSTTKKKAELLAIDGVFLAVRCVVCGTVYAADHTGYVAFFGTVSAGVDEPILEVAAPRRPSKQSLVAVCRTPDCMSGVVRQLLGCGPESEGDAEARWKLVLGAWSKEAGIPMAKPELELEQPPETLAQRRKRGAVKVKQLATTKKRPPATANAAKSRTRAKA